MTSTTERNVSLVVSVVLSVGTLVLLFGVTWYFQSSIYLLQQQVELDKKLLLKLQGQVKVKISCVLDVMPARATMSHNCASIYCV